MAKKVLRSIDAGHDPVAASAAGGGPGKVSARPQPPSPFLCTSSHPPLESQPRPLPVQIFARAYASIILFAELRKWRPSSRIDHRADGHISNRLRRGLWHSLLRGDRKSRELYGLRAGSCGHVHA